MTWGKINIHPHTYLNCILPYAKVFPEMESSMIHDHPVMQHYTVLSPINEKKTFKWDQAVPPYSSWWCSYCSTYIQQYITSQRHTLAHSITTFLLPAAYAGNNFTWVCLSVRLLNCWSQQLDFQYTPIFTLSRSRLTT